MAKAKALSCLAERGGGGCEGAQQGAKRANDNKTKVDYWLLSA